MTFCAISMVVEDGLSAFWDITEGWFLERSVFYHIVSVKQIRQQKSKMDFSPGWGIHWQAKDAESYLYCTRNLCGIRTTDLLELFIQKALIVNVFIIRHLNFWPSHSIHIRPLFVSTSCSFSLPVAVAPLKHIRLLFDTQGPSKSNPLKPFTQLTQLNASERSISVPALWEP